MSPIGVSLPIFILTIFKHIIERKSLKHLIPSTTIDEIHDSLDEIDFNLTRPFSANLDTRLEADQMQNELHQQTIDMYKRRLSDQERQFELDRAEQRDALLSL